MVQAAAAAGCYALTTVTVNKLALCDSCALCDLAAHLAYHNANLLWHGAPAGCTLLTGVPQPPYSQLDVHMMIIINAPAL